MAPLEAPVSGALLRAPVTERRLPVSGADLFVRRAGGQAAGKAVLIAVHGGPGISHELLQSLETLAHSELAVVNYDQRGVGRSTGEIDAGRVLPQALEDLGAVVNAVAPGDEAIHLLGHSWGGLPAALFASDSPQRVTSLVLVDSIGPTSNDLAAGMVCYRQRVQQFQTRGLVPADLPDMNGGGPDEARARLLALLPIYFVDPRHPAARSLGGARVSPSAFRATGAALSSYDVRPRLARVRAPVLHFIAAVPFGPAMATAMADAIGDRNGQTRRVSLTDAGHLPFLERPAAFLATVADFIDAATPPTRTTTGELP